MEGAEDDQLAGLRAWREGRDEAGAQAALDALAGAARRGGEGVMEASIACAHAGVALRDLGAVAVDVGPGLYTGLRVGVTTAITMAHALRVPMVAVSSLDLVAYPLRHTGRTIAAVIDARRGEVFHARYGCLPGGVQRLSEPMVGPPDHVVSQMLASSDETLAVGDGAVRYASMFEGLRGVELADPGFAYPSAESVVLLAHALAVREEFVRPDEIEPLYLRRPDAEAKWAGSEP